SASGADIIEIGVPFSDPVADGITIEAASQAALEAGFCLSRFLERLGDVKLKCPAVLMSYLNPLLAYGDSLFRDLRPAGICGLIVPDLPLEEADDWRSVAETHAIDLIFLVAPTSTDQRVKRIAGATRGFLYAVSVAGTTGIRAELDKNLPEFLDR